VKNYEQEINEIINSPENYNEKVVIFDGTKENALIDYQGMLINDHLGKAKLLNKIKILKVNYLLIIIL